MKNILSTILLSIAMVGTAYGELRSPRYDAEVSAVQFNTDGHTLTAADKETLDAFAERVSTMDSLVVMVIGRADQVGTNEYNYNLGQRRADSVAEHLRSHGVNVINVESLGEEDPVDLLSDSPNRSVTLVFIHR